MFNNEHINEEGLCYCGSLDCIGHVRAMLASMTADRNGAMGSLVVAEAVAKDEVAKREQLQRELAALKSSIENVEEVWREQVQGYDGDWTEDTLLQAIAEEFEFQATEDVEITVTISQTVTVRKPIGTNLNSHDFWMQKDCELLECNYEITEEESASVEDVSE